MSAEGSEADARGRLYRDYVSTGQAAAAAASPLGAQSSDRYLERLVRRHVPPDRSISVLDLGCGQGNLLRCLLQQGYANVVGVDQSSEQVAIARSAVQAPIHQCDITSFLQGRTAEFDVVFLMDVLEHLNREELIRLLDSVFASLRPGGRVIVHAPNAEGMLGMRIRYGDLTHETAFTSRSISQALSLTGFAEIRVFEERPIVHGLKSLARHVIWLALSLRERLLLLAETGARGAVLSQNLLAVAVRPPASRG